LKTTYLFALVAVLTVAGVSSARAGEWGWGPGEGARGGEWGGEWNHYDHADSFCQEHGVKFSHGYFYPGLVQKHFTEKWHDEYFKTDMCFDPHSHMPYYWCEGHGVWYPITYIEKVGPGAKGPGPIVGQPGPGGPAAPGPAAPGGPAPGSPAPGGVAPGGPAPGGPAPAGPAPGGASPDGAAPGGQAPNGPAVVAPAGPSGTPAVQGATPGVVPNAPQGANTDSPPPEPTTARAVPEGTFDDPIPETK
jgi:hypothetical protein